VVFKQCCRRWHETDELPSYIIMTMDDEEQMVIHHQKHTEKEDRSTSFYKLNSFFVPTVARHPSSSSFTMKITPTTL
jgi:hypothetical protein